MTRNDLYDAAFRYKKAKIWRKLWDNGIFALKLPGGEIGYISILGKNGEYCALALYIGEKGFGSYRVLQGSDSYGLSLFQYREMLLQQRCLQMVLCNKEDLRPWELEEARACGKEKGIRFSGKNAFPQFLKFEPNCVPWEVKAEEDRDALWEALTAAVLLAERLQSEDPRSLGLVRVGPYTEKVPLFAVEGDRLLQLGTTPLPGELEEEDMYVEARNEIAISSVKRLKRKGVWEVELLRMLQAVQRNPEEAPDFPLVLLMVERKSSHALMGKVLNHLDEDREELLQDFANTWTELGFSPKEVICADDRTLGLLEDFCEKANIKISAATEELTALEAVEEDMLEYFGGEDTDEDLDEDEQMDMILETAELILSMNRSDLRSIPKPVLKEFKSIIAAGILPPDIARALGEKLKGL